MDEPAPTYEEIIERFVQYARDQESIRAAVVVGSRAHNDADEWADLDMLVVTTDPERILSETDWIKIIGDPVITFIEPMPNGEDMECRVLFKGGLDVDFAVFPFEKVQMLYQMVLQGNMGPEMATALSNLFSRGIRILLDKDDLTGMLEQTIEILGQPSPLPPAYKEFLNVVNDFWYHTVWTAKHLRRGELWWAKGCCDMHLKWLLRRMIEWHAQISNRDTWFRGRFLEKWGDPRVIKELKNAFAHYDEEDIWRALFATMDLFRWLAGETAEQLGYEYPTPADEYATALVGELFAHRSSRA
jgi:aminoglycoside 6-adenylyltransferase